MMQCNIDDRGARFRQRMGFACLILAAMLGAAGIWLRWLWIVAILAAAGGAFSLFEARKKWCAIRAMGIQTRV